MYMIKTLARQRGFLLYCYRLHPGIFLYEDQSDRTLDAVEEIYNSDDPYHTDPGKPRQYKRRRDAEEPQNPAVKSKGYHRLAARSQCKVRRMQDRDLWHKYRLYQHK